MKKSQSKYQIKIYLNILSNMFQHLKNHSATLPASQKFYYDNYEYYNIYENQEKEYKDDLSKFLFHCNRRSTATIVVYGSNPHYMRTAHQRFIKMSQDNLSFYQTVLNTELFQQNRLTMEQFIDCFLGIWIENNYSMSLQSYQKDSNFQEFQIISLSSINDQRYMPQNEACPFNMTLLSLEELALILGKLVEANEQKIGYLEQQYSKDINPGVFNLQCQISFELFANFVLTKKYSDSSSLGFNLLYEFIVEVNRIMWEILNNRFRSVLLLAQPKVQYLHYLIHPLILPIAIFLKYNHSQFSNPYNKLFTGVGLNHRPNIVLINLDGKQSAHNLRNMCSLGQNFLYVSLYNEASQFQQKNTKMDNIFTSEQQNQEVDFKSLCRLYSEFIINQFTEKNRNESPESPEILLFPLNSPYLRTQFYKHNGNGSCPRITTAAEIKFIFDMIIYDKIREFKPTIIFISYNGQLQQLNHLRYDEHSTQLNGSMVLGDIIRNCSILSDHRVVLFPNFTNIFDFDYAGKQQEQEQLMDDDDGKVKCAKQFYEKYYNYEFEKINSGIIKEKVSVNNNSPFDNLVKCQPLMESISLFMKYGPGLYNMQDGMVDNFETPSWKYTMSNRYAYLQLLENIGHFNFMKNRSFNKVSAHQLEELFSAYGRDEIRENQRQNQAYEKLISTVISEFLCQNISQETLKSILEKRLYYRMQDLIESLINEQQQKNNTYSVDQRSLLEQYLNKMKNQLLLQNMENYKTKKHYYYSENKNNQALSKLQMLTFALKTGHEDAMETEDVDVNMNEILLEKYSQIIINQTSSRNSFNMSNISNPVFIVNYRAPQTNRHMILVGDLHIVGEKPILMEQVKQTDRQLSEEVQEYFQYHYLTQEGHSQKQDRVYLNYNHCFFKNILYLYWPLQYNLKQQVRHRLLNQQYIPKRVFKMLKIAPYQDQLAKEITYKYEKVIYQPSNDQDSIEILPRWGCTSYPIDEKSFLILGGIFQNQLDYLAIATNICMADISYRNGTSSFTIKAREKKGNNKIPESSLKPKINYKIQQIESHTDAKIIRFYGGYGRYNTNYFNLFSYDQYEMNLSTFVPKKNNEVLRKIVEIDKPLVINKIGKYSLVNTHDTSNVNEEKFSDTIKEKFIIKKINEAMNKMENYQIHSFLDDTSRVNEFKTHKKKQYLFGFMQTIRQKIYVKCWSPQLYILSDKANSFNGFKPHVINLSLKTQKNSSYIIPNYLMPREDDIMCMCIEEDKIYLVSASPMTQLLQNNSSVSRYILYEGSLSNMNEVLNKREIQMNSKYTLNTSKCDKFIGQKSIMVNQNVIYIVGGLSSTSDSNLSFQSGQMKKDNQQLFERQDYLLYEVRNKYVMKAKKLVLANQSLDMPHSIVVKNWKNYYLYSIVLQENNLMEQNQQNEFQIWKMKIENHCFDGYDSESISIVGQFKLYFYNGVDNQVQRYPSSYLEDPKFVSISSYKRFSIGDIKSEISKIIWILNKKDQKTQLPEIKQMTSIFESLLLNEQLPDEILQAKLLENVNIFEEMIQILSNYASQKQQQAEGNSQKALFEMDYEELMKSLRNSYHLLYKLILEKLMNLGGCSKQPEYRFIVEDKTSKKVKYMAIGTLGTTNLNFYRIRFLNEVIFCFNHSDDSGFFYHPTIISCMNFKHESLKGNLNNIQPYQSIQKIQKIQSSPIKL